MAAYRKQHFLPAVYLKQFSVDQTKLSRNSQIWRCDGKRNGIVTVANECCGNYFYSREHAQATEAMFQGREVLYDECLREIREGKPSTIEKFFGLILIIFDLHLRNAAYDNQTRKDNLYAYRLRFEGLKKLLLAQKESEPTDEEVAVHLKKRWRVRVLARSPEGAFLTSDNPSVLIASREEAPRLQFAVLPITPNYVAIAYDCHQIEVVGGRTTPPDEGLLNKLQLSQAVRCVYSSVQLPTEVQEIVDERLNGVPKVRGKTDAGSWNASFRRLAPEASFSFIRPSVRSQKA